MWLVPILNMYIPYIFLKSVVTINLSNRKIATALIYKYMFFGIFVQCFLIWIASILLGLIFAQFFIYKQSDYYLISLTILGIILILFTASSLYAIWFNIIFKKKVITKQFIKIYKKYSNSSLLDNILLLKNYSKIEFIQNNKTKLSHFVKQYYISFTNLYIWDFFEDIKIDPQKNGEIEFMTNSENYSWLVDWTKIDSEVKPWFLIRKEIWEWFMSPFNEIWGKRFILSSSILVFSTYLKFIFEVININKKDIILKLINKNNRVWTIYSLIWSLTWFVVSLLLLGLLPPGLKIWVLYFSLIVFFIVFVISQLKIFVFNKKIAAKIANLI
ncbi:hypothetical protein [Mycoplasma testudineum]|nr:hypothetical protein [Mycoplasma testudineum]